MITLRAGDIGYYTEGGKLFVVDRIKELIKCMDQQVAPAELEDLLVQHEAVKEAAVTGVPHRDYGEAARAFVVLFQDDAATETLKNELAKLVAGRLSGSLPIQKQIVQYGKVVLAFSVCVA